MLVLNSSYLFRAASIALILLSIGFTSRANADSHDRDAYAGTMRVYIIEIESRWIDYDDAPYHNAFLSFALQEDFNLNENDSLTWSFEWDGNDYGYGDIEEGNIRVVAAVFDSVSYTGSSDPPTGHPFDVHEVDAVAGAKSGRTGYNLVPTGFTHTILVEDASATW